MTRFSGAALVGLVALTAVPFAFGQTDAPGSKDYPGISRMPGYSIADYHEPPFDSYNFIVAEGGRTKKQSVEGRRYDFRYNLAENAPMPSALQIVRNYQNAARSAGGKVLLDTVEATTARLAKGGKEVWFTVQTSNEPSGMYIIMHCCPD
jgi:OmpA-OmpF porin, OOP family